MNDLFSSIYGSFWHQICLKKNSMYQLLTIVFTHTILGYKDPSENFQIMWYQRHFNHRIVSVWMLTRSRIKKRASISVGWHWRENPSCISCILMNFCDTTIVAEIIVWRGWVAKERKYAYVCLMHFCNLLRPMDMSPWWV